MEPADIAPVAVPSPNGDTSAPMLMVQDLQAGYGRKQVVFDVDLQVRAGEILGILGHNGSGKSTTIRTILGINKVFGGRITFDGKDVTGHPSRQNVKAGMAMIPSERFVFQDMSVTDNLLLGGANNPDGEAPHQAHGAGAPSCSRSSSSGPDSSPARCRAASSGWSASAWR